MFRLALVLLVMAAVLSLFAFGLIATTFAAMAKLALFMVASAGLICVANGMIERDSLVIK